jgi:transcriptional regulator
MARNILRSTEAAMPFGEIAKRLGISEANASLICSRALRKLRRSPACMDASVVIHRITAFMRTDGEE